MGFRSQITIAALLVLSTSAFAIEVSKVQADPAFRARMEKVLEAANKKIVVIAPLEDVARDAAVGEELIRFEVNRAWRLISDRKKATGEKVELVDHPEILAKLKTQYVDYLKSIKRSAPPAGAPLTLGQLTELLQSGKLNLDEKDAVSLLGALRVANEKRIYAKAGKNPDEGDIARSLIAGELGVLAKVAPKTKIELPKEINEALNQEFNRVFGGDRPLDQPISSKKLAKLLASKQFRPGVLNDGQWNEALGRARVGGANANPDRFAAGMRSDVVRDFAAVKGDGGTFPLIGEDHPADKDLYPAPIGALPPTVPVVPFAVPPPISRVEPRPGAGGAARGGHPAEDDGVGSIYVPPGLVDASTARSVVSIGGRSVPVQEGVDGLTDGERHGLGAKMKPNGYSRLLYTRYTTTPENRVSTCQITANHMEPGPQNRYCTVAFSTAAHCVRDEERGGALVSLEIPEYGTIPQANRSIFIDPKPGADYAMVVVTHAGGCRSDVPVVKLSRDSIGSRTPLLIDTRRGPIVAAGQPSDLTHFQYNTNDPTNGGETTIKGDSGGGIFTKNANGELIQVGVVSFGIVTANGAFTGTSFGANPTSGTNIIDNLVAANTSSHGKGFGAASHPEAVHSGPGSAPAVPAGKKGPRG